MITTRTPIPLVSQVDISDGDFLTREDIFSKDEKKSFGKSHPFSHFKPLVNIIFKDLKTARSALEIIRSKTPIKNENILRKMLVRHIDGPPMFWCESPYVIEIITQALYGEPQYLNQSQYKKLMQYVELCKKKLRTIKDDIETNIVSNFSDVEFIFRLIDDGDPTALEIYRNKLSHHKKMVLEDINEYTEIIKKNGMDFFLFYILHDDVDTCELLSPLPKSRKDLQHLLNLRTLNQSYSTLKLLDSTLLEILTELEKLCDKNMVPNTLQQLIVPLNKSLHAIQKDEPTLEERICKALKLDDLDALKSIGDYKTIANMKIRETPILIEAAHCGCEEILKFLVRHGADLKAVSPTGENVLTAACTASDPYLRLAEPRLAIVRFLIEDCGFDVNTEGSFRQTILHKAVMAKFSEMIKYLVSDAHADPNSLDDSHHTPLMLLTMHHHYPYEIFDTLIQHHADTTYLSQDSYIIAGYVAYLIGNGSSAFLSKNIIDCLRWWIHNSLYQKSSEPRAEPSDLKIEVPKTKKSCIITFLSPPHLHLQVTDHEPVNLKKSFTDPDHDFKNSKSASHSLKRSASDDSIVRKLSLFRKVKQPHHSSLPILQSFLKSSL